MCEGPPISLVLVSWRICIVSVREQESDPVIFSECAQDDYDNFGLTGNVKDIDGAIWNWRKAIEISHEDHTDFAAWHNSLGMALIRRFERKGKYSDIEDAILALQKSVSLVTHENETPPSHFNNLGCAMLLRFGRTGDLADIKESIAFQKKAIDMVEASGGTGFPTWHSNLGSAYRNLFLVAGDAASLDLSIAHHQRAQSLVSEGDGSEALSNIVHNLGAALQLRFASFGNPEDIHAAIAAQRKAVALTPEGNPQLPKVLNNLGLSLRHNFEHHGDLTNIDESISVHKTALELTPEGHASLPSFHNNLGIALGVRFDHTRDLVDIQEAISNLQKAVSLAPEGHASLPSWLANLGQAFLRRSDLTLSGGDAREAVLVQEKALTLIPEGHTHTTSHLSNQLAISYLRSLQLNEGSDELQGIEKVISILRNLVESASPGHAELPLWTNNLGTAFEHRYRHTEDPDDLDEAIATLRKALELLPSEKNSRVPGWTVNLADYIKTRFHDTRSFEDIQEVIALYQRAVSLLPDGHQAFSVYQRKLADSLVMRYADESEDDIEHEGWIADLKAAIEIYRTAAQNPSCPSTNRLIAARKWANWSHFFDPASSLPAYAKLIELLSSLVGLENTMQRRHETLAQYSSLTLKAAATAFEVEQPLKALEWLEQGRCLVWNQLNNLRTPLDNLRAHDAALADRLLHLSKALEVSGTRDDWGSLDSESTFEDKISIETEATTHLKSAKEYEDMLSVIRAISGFEHFLRPPPASSLLDWLPKSGYVVVINVHGMRCDALALKAGEDEPIHIPLPEFNYSKAKEHRDKMNQQLASEGLRMRSAERSARPVERTSRRAGLHAILAELWIDIVEPIVDELELEVCTPTERIWWCATGPLSSLPLHAAGIYKGNASTRVDISQYAVSSYIPTVGSLTDRVKRQAAFSITKPISMQESGILLVSQPNAPGMAPIPGTTREIHAISALISSQNVNHLTLEDEAATTQSVISHLPLFSHVHLACHASQNASQPLSSGFYLADGRLELSRIIKSNLTASGANLAFLSACQTSAGDQKLSEEAVHLAAGMLAAGYMGVVATMWSIQDEHAPGFATDFYGELVRVTAEAQGQNNLGTDSGYAAASLHHAQKRLREKLGDSERALWTWIPYVHFGL
ncbi:CHAT domain-containing protein [Ephemerocybe angulata]|uniref:CHAT domain-containing protein n=1 Tax=Ephemerocybe angulata TaxID=980116 RepID=A0A8H6HXL8_9AGAR|nr:CHAT domain-containing protein [Tulosesus angulatus]